MKRTIKERLLALMCVVTMVTATFLTWLPAKAADSTVVTVEDKLEEGFTPWTFSDVGIDDQTLEGTFNWTTAKQSSLDKTVFNGKILFPEGTGNDMGNLYIGGTTDSGDSLYSGFLIRGAASNAISIAFADASGTVVYSKNLWEANTDTTLRGNAEMQLSLSVEYTNVTTDGLVTMQVGVFFNGKLYNNDYITISNVPERCLTQHVKWYSPENSPALKAHKLGNITLENAPEKEYKEWTFSDLGVEDQKFSGGLNWNSSGLTYPCIGNSMDETIFNAKINFANYKESTSTSYENCGTFFIGGASENTISRYRGFRVYANGQDGLKMDFQYSDSGTKAIGTFDSTTAGTVLRGNPNLQFSLSVKYVSENPDGTVNVKVGVFFDGKLYNNTYFMLESLSKDLFYMNVRVNMGPAGGPNTLASASLNPEDNGIYLANAPEREFEEWSLDDIGIADQDNLAGVNINWSYPATTAKTLDKSLFSCKLYIPDGGWNDAGQFYIGGSSDTTSKKECGFRIRGNSNKMWAFDFVDKTTTQKAFVNLSPSVAGTDLRANRNLLFQMSVEVISVTDGLATVKIGLFFDGKLYNNEYITWSGLDETCLTRHVKWAGAKNNAALASHHSFDITLKDAPENNFEYWTLRDINISDTSITESGNWNNTITNTQSLDKTIFHAKINFLAGSNGFGHFYIGGATDDGAYRGFRFAPDGSAKIQFDFIGPGGKQYNDKGAGGGEIVKFDSTTAGTTLRGNRELQFSLSVEVLEDTRETIDGLSYVDVKAGVFFDGKLYDNTYYTIADVPEKYLTNNIRWMSAVNGCELASLAKAENVLLSNNATISTSHVDMYSENTGYGMDTLFDGVVGQNDPYYLGAVGADLQNEPMTFDFAFDNAYSIDSVRLHKYRTADGFPVDFTISAYTTDGWKTVVTKTNYQSTAGWNEFNFADTVCSAVRLTVTENGKHAGGDTFGMHLTEFEVWGVSSSAELCTPYTIGEEATVIAYGKNDSALNDGTLVGNNGYRVLSESQAESAKMQLMFNFPVTVDGIQLSAQEAGEFPSAFTIYAFTGSGWEAVHTETNYTPNATKTLHEFKFDTAVTCSSIMVEVSSLCDIYDAGNIYGLQIQEIRLNGAKKANGCTLLGDGNVDELLTETEDMAAFRTALAESDTPGAIYEVNKDGANDCRDLVRMKRYFANEDRGVKTYDFTTLSLNVRNLTNTNGYQSQEIRAPYIAAYINQSGAEIVALQEARNMNKFDWPSAMNNGLCQNGAYEAVPAMESSKENTYDLMMFYNPNRFQLVNSGIEEYSDYTVDSEKRYIQWAQFTDKQSGETVFATNTHWSHNPNYPEMNDEDRKVQAQQLLSFLQEQVGNKILIAVGDYNARWDSEPVKILSGGIYKEANAEIGGFGTLHLDHIDHAFVNPKQSKVEQCYNAEGTYKYTDGTIWSLSDHLPLIVKLSYKYPR